MRRQPPPPIVIAVSAAFMFGLSLLLATWIYQVAHVTQPQYSDPDYGVTRTYQP